MRAYSEKELNFQRWSEAFLTHILYSETTILESILKIVFIQVFVSFNNFNLILKCKDLHRKTVFNVLQMLLINITIVCKILSLTFLIMNAPFLSITLIVFVFFQSS